MAKKVIKVKKRVPIVGGAKKFKQSPLGSMKKTLKKVKQIKETVRKLKNPPKKITADLPKKPSDKTKTVHPKPVKKTSVKKKVKAFVKGVADAHLGVSVDITNAPRGKKGEREREITKQRIKRLKDKTKAKKKN